MSDLPASWVSTSINAVTVPFETTDPTRTPNDQFTYVDIGAIDNLRQEITSPKTFSGKDAPSRARRVIRAGDTLFSTVRTYLKNVALVPPELEGALTSTGIAVLRPHQEIDPHYLFHWARSDAFIGAVGQSEDGTMYPAVRDADVSAGAIPLAPSAEQRRIVAKLNSLGARSSRARKELDHIPSLIERYKQAIVARAFEDADGATETPLGELMAHGPQNGLYLPKSDYGSGTPILRIENYGFGGAAPIAEWSKVNIGPDTVEKYALATGDIVINRVNSPSHLGKSLLIDHSHVPAVFESNMMRIHLCGEVRSEYVQLFLGSDAGRKRLTADAKWAVNQASINQADVCKTKVPVPSPAVQTTVISAIKSAMAWLDNISLKHGSAEHLLPKLDQAILAKAFRGELVAQDPNEEPASALLARLNQANGSGHRAQRRASDTKHST